MGGQRDSRDWDRRIPGEGARLAWAKDGVGRKEGQRKDVSGPIPSGGWIPPDHDGHRAGRMGRRGRWSWTVVVHWITDMQGSPLHYGRLLGYINCKICQPYTSMRQPVRNSGRR